MASPNRETTSIRRRPYRSESIPKKGALRATAKVVALTVRLMRSGPEWKTCARVGSRGCAA
jgi:hypothetical protein